MKKKFIGRTLAEVMSGSFFYSPQTFEANLNPSLVFFLLLSSSVRRFVKIKDLMFSLGLEGFYGFPLAISRGCF